MFKIQEHQLENKILLATRSNCIIYLTASLKKAKESRMPRVNDHCIIALDQKKP